MKRTDDHGACVDAWLGLVAGGQTPELLVEALEAGFSAVSRRLRPIVGEATTKAITNRVLRQAARQIPSLAFVRVGDGGLSCGGLRARAGSLPPAEIAGGVRLVLVDFLGVLGRLTSDVLTPGLHAELWKVAAALPAVEDGAREGIQA